MIEYYSHNKLEDWKTSFLQMTCKSNEQRKVLALRWCSGEQARRSFYVMTQPLLFKIDCKVSANRAKNQIILNFSEVQPNFDAVNDSANRSEDKVFKLFYGSHSFIFPFFTNFAPQKVQ